MPGWPDPAGTLGFGRFDESRKGFAVLRDALGPISARPAPGFAAGPGNAGGLGCRQRFEPGRLLGMVLMR
jgi:hypothetical protein